MNAEKSSYTYKTFTEFWPFYVSQHLENTNRWLHFVGTFFTFVVLYFVLQTGDGRLLLGIPIVGYGFAWSGHFFFEKNRPATFTYPVWSLVADYKMFFLILIGRMAPELDRVRTSNSRQ